MKKLQVCPGICALKTVITAVSEDGMNVKLSVDSECEAIRAMASELTEVDGYAACLCKPGQSTVYEAAARCLNHGSCPVPCAFLKAIEAECMLALPADVTMHFEGEE